MKRHSPAQQLWEAKQVAKEHGLFVVEKQDAPGQTKYILYRRCQPLNHVIGTRHDIAQFRRFVFKCAGVA